MGVQIASILKHSSPAKRGAGAELPNPPRPQKRRSLSPHLARPRTGFRFNQPYAACITASPFAHLSSKLDGEGPGPTSEIGAYRRPCSAMADGSSSCVGAPSTTQGLPNPNPRIGSSSEL